MRTTGGVASAAIGERGVGRNDLRPKGSVLCRREKGGSMSLCSQPRDVRRLRCGLLAVAAIALLCGGSGAGGRTTVALDRRAAACRRRSTGDGEARPQRGRQHRRLGGASAVRHGERRICRNRAHATRHREPAVAARSRRDRRRRRVRWIHAQGDPARSHHPGANTAPTACLGETRRERRGCPSRRPRRTPDCASLRRAQRQCAGRHRRSGAHSSRSPSHSSRRIAGAARQKRRPRRRRARPHGRPDGCLAGVGYRAGAPVRAPSRRRHRRRLRRRCGHGARGARRACHARSRSSRPPTASSPSTRRRTPPMPLRATASAATAAGVCTLRAAIDGGQPARRPRHHRVQHPGQRRADDPDAPASCRRISDLTRRHDDRRLHAARFVAQHDAPRRQRASCGCRSAARARRSRTTCSPSPRPNNVVRGLAIFNGRPIGHPERERHAQPHRRQLHRHRRRGHVRNRRRWCATAPASSIGRGATQNRIGTPAPRRPQRDLGHRVHRRLLHRRRHQRQLRPEQHHRPQPVGHRRACATSAWASTSTSARRDNLIGGTGPGERNVLSGQRAAAGSRSPTPPATAGNQVIGNFIGTDLTGISGARATRTTASRACTWRTASEHARVSGNVDRRQLLRRHRRRRHRDRGTRIVDNHIGVAPHRHGDGQRRRRDRRSPHARDITISGNTIAHQPRRHPARPSRQRLQHDHAVTAIFGEQRGLGIDLAPLGAGEPERPRRRRQRSQPGAELPGHRARRTRSVTGTACANCTVEVFVADRGAGANGSGKTFLGSGDRRRRRQPSASRSARGAAGCRSPRPRRIPPATPPSSPRTCSTARRLRLRPAAASASAAATAPPPPPPPPPPTATAAATATATATAAATATATATAGDGRSRRTTSAGRSSTASEPLTSVAAGHSPAWPSNFDVDGSVGTTVAPAAGQPGSRTALLPGVTAQDVDMRVTGLRRPPDQRLRQPDRAPRK